MQDPTREEMLEHLRMYGGDDMLDGEDRSDEYEIAIYWFANDWHGGQASTLYSVLSTSPYKPSILATDVETSESETIHLMYQELVAQFGFIDEADEREVPY